jgi:transcriptional regulator with PAS, ATPase and Fis domain
MRGIYAEVKKIARYNINVLLLGESGTGKEVFAELIHVWSDRKTNKLVKQNCSALPETLLESELFGYNQGAFSGAVKSHDGIFKYADNGTLLLDEIGDLSLIAQSKILRVVQDGYFKRVGSNTEDHTNFRLICATNRDLRTEFRMDLYYRIAEEVITIPPLRERKEDLIDLCNFLIKEFATINHVKGLSFDAQQKLYSYNYPGNIRELKSMLKRALILTPANKEIKSDDIHLNLEPKFKKIEMGSDSGLSLEDIERKAILRALEETIPPYNQKIAAGLLNISARALNYKIKSYGITHHTWRKNA